MDRHELEQNISDAIQAHGAWKEKFKTAIETGVLPKPARDIACDDQCGFGKWLIKLKSDRSVAASAHYQDVAAAHAAFHRTAGAVAALVEAGDIKAAERALNGAEFDEATYVLLNKVNAWKIANRN